jgi:hypothetical protein
MASGLIPSDCPHTNRFSHYSRIKADAVSHYSIFKDLAGRSGPSKKIAPITQWMGFSTERYGSEDKSERVWF